MPLCLEGFIDPKWCRMLSITTATCISSILFLSMSSFSHGLVPDVILHMCSHSSEISDASLRGNAGVADDTSIESSRGSQNQSVSKKTLHFRSL